MNDGAAFAYAFDLLLLDGDDIRRAPLSERRERLTKLLRKAKPGMRLSEHIEADGAVVFDHACKLGVEGIVVMAGLVPAIHVLASNGDLAFPVPRPNRHQK